MLLLLLIGKFSHWQNFKILQLLDLFANLWIRDRYELTVQSRSNENAMDWPELSYHCPFRSTKNWNWSFVRASKTSVNDTKAVLKMFDCNTKYIFTNLILEPNKTNLIFKRRTAKVYTLGKSESLVVFNGPWPLT